MHNLQVSIVLRTEQTSSMLAALPTLIAKKVRKFTLCSATVDFYSENSELEVKVINETGKPGFWTVCALPLSYTPLSDGSDWN